ncbi:MAG: type IX secretion system membrane protein PorP/SprF [Bacteroidetes bacterium]|nr:type IX secretion system membrane protein PorP/SprF [Bacteroidota bacterium]
MKKYIYTLLLLTLSEFAVSQQVPMYSQYMFNDYVYNPAVAGTKDYYQAKSNNRYQWLGITDAPRTYILSVNGPHKTRNMGFGGYVFNDVTGPTSRTGLYGSYAYNVKINEQLRFSSGLSLGLLQYKIDGSRIILHDQNDQTLSNGMYTDYLPDANLGLFLYSKSYSVGLAVNQLFNNNINFKEVEQLGINKIKSHFILYGSYLYQINDDFDVEPTLLLKFVSPAPIQADISAKVTYKNMVWLGFSYRTKDALSVMVGYNYKDQLSFGYSYDLSITDIKKYSTGTHELMLGIRFNKFKESESRAKIE